MNLEEMGLKGWMQFSAFTTAGSFVLTGITITLIGIIRQPTEWVMWLLKGSGIIHDVSVVTVLGCFTCLASIVIWAEMDKK